ncbi:MAG: hypothetical protein HYW77_01915 [Parcubacteria group bacterium]|nr:hypothetical protein [Parcubacteria group bacterium]
MKSEIPSLPNDSKNENALDQKVDFIERTKMKCKKIGNRLQCFLGGHDFIEIPGEHQILHGGKDEEIKMKCQRLDCKAKTTVRLHEGHTTF